MRSAEQEQARAVLSCRAASGRGRPRTAADPAISRAMVACDALNRTFKGDVKDTRLESAPGEAARAGGASWRVFLQSRASPVCSPAPRLPAHLSSGAFAFRHSQVLFRLE